MQERLVQLLANFDILKTGLSLKMPFCISVGGIMLNTVPNFSDLSPIEVKKKNLYEDMFSTSQLSTLS